MPKIKVCGVTRLNQARDIAAAGVDAIGLNFVSGAARAVALSEAEDICAELRGRVALVALFSEPSEAKVREVLERCPVDFLQFHGDEVAVDCERYGKPYLKAVHMTSAVSAQHAATAHPAAYALLLDAVVAGRSGGTGQVFDWRLWPKDLSRRLVVAGGLAPDNVGAAIAATKPWAVDVSTGVESGTKGVKDLAKVRQFVNEVRKQQ